MNKKWLALALKIAVSGGLMWYLVDSIDLEAAGRRIIQVDPLMLVGAACLLLFQMIIAGFRWNTVLKGIGIGLPFWETVRLFYVGTFFNQALPGGTGGDVVRVYMVFKADWGLRGALNGVILERVATVLALVMLVVGMLPFFVSNLEAEERAWIIPSVAVVSAAAACGLVVLCLLDRFPSGLRRWRVVRGLGNLADDARVVFLRPGVALPALIWSALGHANIAFAVYILALGLNLDITAFDSIVLMPPVLLAMTIPVSIGAWGVRENAMVVAFGLIGVSAEAATVLGVLLGLVGMAVAIPGGILWLSGRNRGGPSLADVEAELASAEAKEC